MMRRIIGIVRAIWALPAAAHETHISLRVGLDPEAASLLADRGERVIVASWFYGEPVPTDKLPPDDLAWEGNDDTPTEVKAVRGNSALADIRAMLKR